MVIRFFLALILLSHYTAQLQASDLEEKDKFLVCATAYIQGSIDYFQNCPIIFSNKYLSHFKSDLSIVKVYSLQNIPLNSEALKTFSKQNVVYKEERTKFFQLLDSSIFLQKKNIKKRIEEKNINIPQLIQTHMNFLIQQYILNEFLYMELPNLNPIVARSGTQEKFKELLSIPSEFYEVLGNFNKIQCKNYLYKIQKIKREHKKNIITKIFSITSIQNNYKDELNSIIDTITQKKFNLADQEYDENDMRQEIQKQLYLARYYFILSKAPFGGSSSEICKLAQEKHYKTLTLAQKILELEKSIQDKDILLSFSEEKVELSHSVNEELRNKIKKLEEELHSRKEKLEEEIKTFLINNTSTSNTKQLKKKKETLQKNNDQLNKNNKTLVDDLKNKEKEYTNKLSSLNDDLTRIKQSLEEERENSKKFSQEIESLTKRDKLKEKENSDLKKELQRTNQEMRNLISANRGLQHALNENERNLQTFIDQQHYEQQEYIYYLEQNIEYLMNINHDLFNKNSYLHQELTQVTASFNLNPQRQLNPPNPQERLHSPKQFLLYLNEELKHNSYLQKLEMKNKEKSSTTSTDLSVESK